VGLDEVSSHWVFADTPDAAAMLASTLHSATPAINFPLSYLDVFQTSYPDWAISIDLLYLLPASHFKDRPGYASGHEVVCGHVEATVYRRRTPAFNWSRGRVSR
jgi:hypothetical protein